VIPFCFIREIAGESNVTVPGQKSNNEETGIDPID
jgi:hypothetical protein